MPLNERSKKNLVGVHPDLVRIIEHAAEREAFIVTEGLRNLERQRKLVAAGASKTVNSRHLTGHAVDIAEADGHYDDPDLDRIAASIKASAAELKIPLEWGFDLWKWDKPHFQLPWGAYPATGVSFGTKVKEWTTKVVTSKPALTVATGAGTAAVSSSTPVPAPSIPSPPDMSAALAWKGFGETLASLWGFMEAHPVLTLGLGGWIVTTLFWNQIKAGWAEWRAS
jgi:peptidoglycan L-alanyl-D-glutamate endopeptidase CwlK